MLLTRLRVGVTIKMLIGGDPHNPGVILTRVRYPAPEIDDGCFCFHFELFISLLVFLRFESDIYTDTIVTFSLFFSHIRCTIRRAQTHSIALAPHQGMVNVIV